MELNVWCFEHGVSVIRLVHLLNFSFCARFTIFELRKNFGQPSNEWSSNVLVDQPSCKLIGTHVNINVNQLEKEFAQHQPKKRKIFGETIHP